MVTYGATKKSKPVYEKYGMRYDKEVTLICGCCKNKVKVVGQDIRWSLSTRWGDATEGWEMKSVGILGADPHGTGYRGVLESDYLAEEQRKKDGGEMYSEPFHLKLPSDAASYR
tara:strand:+ start:82 stop:423 length:342 start_codon:yes stop_codon:yes gene_type:complete